MTKTAFVAEESGGMMGDDPLIATGRFCVHVEDGTADGYEPGLDGVSADEAIAWGRERADRVLVRVCEGEEGTTHYSAGVEPIEWYAEGALPQWPEGQAAGAAAARGLGARGPYRERSVDQLGREGRAAPGLWTFGQGARRDPRRRSGG